MKRTNIASKNQIIGSETSHIVIIGAGNVATHIARHLHLSGHKIDCVYSRTAEPAEMLALELGIRATTDPREVPQQAGFYLVCVPDGAVSEVAGHFRHCEGIWLHTAGGLSMEVFKGIFPRYGVFYPLQTLSKTSPVSPSQVPCLVEGSSDEVTASVTELAASVYDKVELANSATRLVIHMAAVFANNFSNHMVHVAQQLLKDQNLDHDLLDPLLEETFQKIIRVGAKEAQTGPAVRDDQETMLRHIELLKNHPEWEKLYTFISRDIGRSREE
ncbi:MAG: DUF2520 domain-containing protein [Bacteroidales bacterium]|nr:DUF2520 domain-containing protein [Bacteroidales bacterium]